MAIGYKDYYATLGVERTASDDEIKKAFRKLARQYHPDVAKDKRTAEERFKEINEAYEVLGTPEDRRRYDQLGANWKHGAEFRPPPGWGGAGAGAPGRQSRRRPGAEADDEFQFGGTGFSEFFESLFGGRGRGSAHFGEEAEDMEGPGSRGGDIEGDLLVALDEVLHGSVRTINVERVSGRSGRVSRSGFQVRIPAGVREGQLIRVAERGHPGPNGVPGDLYLRVRYAKHPDFRVQNLDVWLDLPLAPWEAVLGATVTVPSLDGPLSLKVPPGSKNGQQLRVRGRGLPSTEGTRGDLYAVVSVEVPTAVNAEERELWERLARTSRFQARPTA